MKVFKAALYLVSITAPFVLCTEIYLK